MRGMKEDSGLGLEYIFFWGDTILPSTRLRREMK